MLSTNISSPKVANTEKSKSPSFLRTQLVLAVWCVLLVIAGLLHNANGRSWGTATTLWMWFGISLIGLAITYAIQPLMLNSGMLLVWAGLILIGFVSTWAALFPLNLYKYLTYTGWYIATFWHFLFMLGYLVVGYYMDRRFWFLSLWEIFLTVFMLLIAFDILDVDIISNNSGLSFGLSAAVGLLVAAVPVWKPRNHL